MPEVLHVGATVLCTHAASASITSTNTRVKVSGQYVALLSDTTTVAGCPFQVPVGAGTKPQPCVEIQWLIPSARVRVSAQPILLKSSTGLCLSAEQLPQGAPSVTVTQIRVKAQ